MKIYSILIIDDEIYIRDCLADFFRDEGYHVEVAESGEDALRLMRKRRFNVCIVDIRLSGIDGARTILHIKALDKQTKFLVFTGSLEFTIIADLAKLGLKKDDIIFKPVMNLDVIAEKVRAMGFIPKS